MGLPSPGLRKQSTGKAVQKGKGNRPGSGMNNRTNSRLSKEPAKIQVTSYQIDSCELLGNRIHK